MKPSVVVIGASTDRKKFGNKAVRAYVAAGYDVYPVHPTERQIEGLPAFPSISAVPVERVDRVTFYLAPARGIMVLPELVSKQIGQLILNPGTESAELIARAQELGLNVVTGCSIIMGGFRPEQFPDE
jgi:uncharacterized protein